MIENILMYWEYCLLIIGIFFTLGCLAQMLIQRSRVDTVCNGAERVDWFSRLYGFGVFLIIFIPFPVAHNSDTFDYVFIGVLENTPTASPALKSFCFPKRFECWACGRGLNKHNKLICPEGIPYQKLPPVRSKLHLEYLVACCEVIYFYDCVNFHIIFLWIVLLRSH